MEWSTYSFLLCVKDEYSTNASSISCLNRRAKPINFYLVFFLLLWSLFSLRLGERVCGLLENRRKNQDVRINTFSYYDKFCFETERKKNGFGMQLQCALSLENQHFPYISFIVEKGFLTLFGKKHLRAKKIWDLFKPWQFFISNEAFFRF